MIPICSSSFKLGCTIAVFFLVGLGAPAARAAQERPNVVLIYADDLGYGDLSCYGGEGRIETPHSDRLAAEGIRFSQAYTAASVCTPARYGLLTGRHPWRTWLDKGVVGNTPALIDSDTFTMADLFKTAGYSTGIIGKWHLGFGDRGQRDLDWNAAIPKGPRELGFDYFFGMPVSHFYPPYVYIENRHVHNLDPSDPLHLEWPEGGGMPTQHGGKSATYEETEAGRELAERACRFIEEHAGEPFFLFYTAIEPHTPFTPHPDYLGASEAGIYGDFVVQFDDGIGRILETLERQGIAENTIVIVTSDNGGISSQNGYLLRHGIDYNPNAPLRGDKGDFLEGGIRIPFIIRWPGETPPGLVSDAIISQIDLLAAFAELVDVSVPEGAAEDSRNVLDALKGGAAPDGPIVAQSRAGFHALRDGEWIFLDADHAGDWGDEPTVSTPAQLYHLSEDLRQNDNRFDDEPERAEALQAALERVRNPEAPEAGSGQTIEIHPKTPEAVRMGWNAPVWGEASFQPVSGNHYIQDLQGVWLLALDTYGSFRGESLTLRDKASIWLTGVGSLGEGELVLDGGTIQNRHQGTSPVTGRIRVESDGRILLVTGPLRFEPELSGGGELELVALREPVRLILGGEDAGYTGRFVFGKPAAEGARLEVVFETAFPGADLVVRDLDTAFVPTLVLGGELRFASARLPREGGGMITLEPGVYDADALRDADVSSAAFEDFGGALRIGSRQE